MPIFIAFIVCIEMRHGNHKYIEVRRGRGANQGIRMNAAQPLRQTQSSSQYYYNCKYICIKIYHTIIENV